MDFLASTDDFQHLSDELLLEMIENDANSQVLDCDVLSDVDDLKESAMNFGMSEFDKDDANNSEWLQQNFQWNDTSKVPQSLIDASNEVENNNPNLFVDPQSVLPVQSTYQVQTQIQQIPQLSTQDGIPVKFNGQNAVLTTSQVPQIQYVTVQNVSGDNSQIGYTVQPVQLCTQPLRTVQSLSTPSQSSPVLVEHLQNRVSMQSSQRRNNRLSQPQKQEKVYPKPSYSYSCLIALALKNSDLGHLPVSEIYNFMTYNFPYFKTAPDGWKNSVRHNLSLNKCFNKVQDSVDTTPPARKGCLWELNMAKKHKIEEEIVKWRKKDPESVKQSMSKPETLELMEQGKIGPPGSDSSSKPRNSVRHEPPVSIKQERVPLPPATTTPATLTHATLIKQEPLSSVSSCTSTVLTPMTPVKYEPMSPISSAPSAAAPTTLTRLTPLKQEGLQSALTAAPGAASIATMTHRTPVKQLSQASQVCGTPLSPQTPGYTLQQARTCSSNVNNVSPGLGSPQRVNRFDPSLSDLSLQNQLWDEDLAIGVSGSSSNQATLSASPLASPTHHNNGVSYYGNITYACTSSPLAAGSQIYNTPPGKRIKLSC